MAIPNYTNYRRASRPPLPESLPPYLDTEFQKIENAFRQLSERGDASSGTVTSVDAESSAPGFTLTGGPITAAGALTFSISNQASARASLGLGSSATLNVGAAAGTVAAGDDSRFANNVKTTGGVQEIIGNSFFVFNNSGTSIGAPLGGAGTLQLYANGPAIVGTIGNGDQSGYRAYAIGNITNNRFARLAGTYGSFSQIATNDVIGDLNFFGAIGPTITGIGGVLELSRIRTTYVGANPLLANNRAATLTFFVGRDGSTALSSVLSIAYQNATVTGNILAGTDNAFSCGGPSNRWSAVYSATGAINTSDERHKQEIQDIGELLLNAWGNVQWKTYRFKDAFAIKGAEARWHFGMIAQQVRDSLDGVLGEGSAARLGLVCHDSWDAREELRDDQGEVIQEASEAGDRWGLRYDECFALEAAYQRRRMDRIEARLATLGA